MKYSYPCLQIGIHYSESDPDQKNSFLDNPNKDFVIIHCFCFFFQIGDPAKTAWEINDRGNKVWFTYEHSPSIFPVKETRFYKPKLHTKNFMNPEEDDEENEKSIWKFERITTRWFYFIKHIIILFILWCSIHRSCYEIYFSILVM